MSNPDDLDDGLLYDYESDHGEHQGPTEGSDLEEEFSAETKKRAIEDESDKERPLEDEGDNKGLSKRQKKLKSSKFHEKKKEQLEYEVGRRKNLPKSSPETIAEYLATLIREKNPDLSALELDELYLKKSDFLSTEKLDKDRCLANFSDFVNEFSRAPRALVLSMSNIRVADVFRSLNGSKSCLKLFSKNKLKDDIASLEQALDKTSNKKFKDIKYLISTPTRMSKILENTDVLFQGKEKLDIILDASYLDPKKDTLLSSENTIILCKVLKAILEKKSSVKILLY